MYVNLSSVSDDVVNYGNDNVTCQRLFGEDLVTIGERLKQERLRLGLSQTALAALVGTTKKSQISYEKGVMPDAGYLSWLALSGADIQYIVTGQRQGGGIGESAIHQAVLDAVDLLSLGKKVDAQQLASAVIKLIDRTATPNVSPMNQLSVIGGDAQQFNAPISGGVAMGKIIHKTKGNPE